MVTGMITRKFKKVEELNRRIAMLQAERDIVVFEAIKEGGFEDFPHFNNAYIKWHQAETGS